MGKRSRQKRGRRMAGPVQLQPTVTLTVVPNQDGTSRVVVQGPGDDLLLLQILNKAQEAVVVGMAKKRAQAAPSRVGNILLPNGPLPEGGPAHGSTDP